MSKEVSRVGFLFNLNAFTSVGEIGVLNGIRKMKIRDFFQIISYLQYPLMLLALFYACKPYFYGFEYLKDHFDLLLMDYNNVLIFMGFGISLSTLQDTSKTQNNFSKRIWENPKKGRLAIILITCLTFTVLAFGVFGYFFSPSENLKELSFGIIVLGIGLVGFLKAAIEVFENHRRSTL
ncbi:hypothetical protein [Algoriphagus sp. Y33]|uniref:hypothetical protein n=1 Tax=Algoriphagus sp. Y33 TaxID=2772483 RepID=UPI001CE1FBBB|nr:hypothetical protein [Algoriphagus sp. Y33]